MSKSDYAPMMYQQIQAVSDLNKVKGFDPLKLLRRAKSPNTGEEVLMLDLPYKKLWFRLACPKGRLKLKPLRITEQMAIYEAQVFWHRDDVEPISSFTSSILASQAPNGQYIQAAQEEALNMALTDAGFGIQLADVSTPVSQRHFGSEIPVAALEGKAVTTTNPKMVPSEKQSVAPAAPPVAAPVPPEASQMPVSKSVAFVPPVASQPAVVNEAPKAEAMGANQALEILRGRVDDTAPAPAEAPAAPVTVSYTESTPVDEILQVMTLEEAKKVVVDVGSCRGMTMEEVAARRIGSVRFYMTEGYESKNNMVRAAARIVWDSLKKAS